jgi:hypothetical protein
MNKAFWFGSIYQVPIFDAFYGYGMYRGGTMKAGIGIQNYLRITYAGETPKT